MYRLNIFNIRWTVHSVLSLLVISILSQIYNSFAVIYKVYFIWRNYKHPKSFKVEICQSSTIFFLVIGLTYLQFINIKSFGVIILSLQYILPWNCLISFMWIKLLNQIRPLFMRITLFALKRRNNSFNGCRPKFCQLFLFFHSEKNVDLQSKLSSLDTCFMKFICICYFKQGFHHFRRLDY